MAIIVPQAAKDLIRSKYLGKDFDTYVQEIVQFMQLEFDPTTFNNFFASDLGVMLVETVAFALSQASWYVDRQVSENFLETAVLRNSVARLSRQVGFKMPGAVPPSVDLSISFETAQTFPVVVPKGFEYVTAEGIVYQQTADVLFAVGEVGPKTVTAVQGETREEFFSSDGTPNQVFQLRGTPPGEFIGEGTTVVSVDSVIWTPVDFLIFEPINEYEVELNREPPQIRFGDGVAGNIPPIGADIRVTYLSTKGPAGKVKAGEIQQPRVPLVVGVTTIPLVVTNPNPSTAGGEAMRLSEAKVLAPAVFSTAKRLVTKEDYDAIINSFVDPLFGRVAIGTANIIRSFSEDSFLVTILENIDIQCGQIAAQLVVHSTSVDGNVTYVAKTKGTSGNSVRVRHLVPVPAGPQPLSVTISGQDITVNLETDGLGNVLSTSSQVATAVNTAVLAQPDPSLLATATAEGSGGGLAGVLPTFTNLSGGGPNTVVQGLLSSLEGKLDEIVSAACKANLVEVQILAADATGRYIAPTAGLAQALKVKLDSMKESTVQVIVFDGSRNLFSVNATVAIKVIDGFNAVVVSENVKAEMEGFLIGKKYGQSVRISDAYALVEAVEGVEFSHIEFQVPSNPGMVDPATGDVLVNPFQVVTLGTVTVTLI